MGDMNRNISQNRIAILAVSQYVKNRNNIESWPKYRNTIESSHFCQFPHLARALTHTYTHSHTHTRADTYITHKGMSTKTHKILRQHTLQTSVLPVIHDFRPSGERYRRITSSQPSGVVAHHMKQKHTHKSVYGSCIYI